MIRREGGRSAIERKSSIAERTNSAIEMTIEEI
jgi:hypothetical protein